jgi:hypothetical protein
MHTDSLIVRAGQAGLSLSRSLVAAGVPGFSALGLRWQRTRKWHFLGGDIVERAAVRPLRAPREVGVALS